MARPTRRDFSLLFFGKRRRAATRSTRFTRISSSRRVLQKMPSTKRHTTWFSVKKPWMTPELPNRRLTPQASAVIMLPMTSPTSTRAWQPSYSRSRLTAPVPPTPIPAGKASSSNSQAAKVGWELFDDADFPAVVGEFVHWAPDKDGVNILFDQYSIAAYVFGQHECRLSWADLAPWLKPRGPLPPQEH